MGGPPPGGPPPGGGGGAAGAPPGPRGRWAKRAAPPVELDYDERLDELRGTPFRIVQKLDGTAYAVDAILLGRFAELPAQGRVADLGCGDGILPLLVKARRPKLAIVGYELQAELVGLARRNLALNGLADVAIEAADVRELPALVLPESFDVVLANPPYYPLGSGAVPERAARALARHEIAGTLADFVASAAWLLPYGGRLDLVLPAARFYEVDKLLPAHVFAIRRLRFVRPRPGENAHLVLLEAERFYNGPRQGLPDLTVRDERGGFTPEMTAIYEGRAG